MPRIDISSAEERRGSGYPAPFDKACAARVRKRLGDAGGLTDFGVNLLTLLPGTWSSQRHWHSREDEFVYVVSGEVMLVTDAGEEILRAGDCAGFPKGVTDGHHLINRSNDVALCLEVGTRAEKDRTDYPDIDLIFDENLEQYTHRDGRPYPERG
jgi:uncharacterized cupin superfamily protein